MTGTTPSHHATDQLENLFFRGLLVEIIGGKILEERLSRVDACIDIAGLPVTILQELVEQKQFISMARRVKPQWEIVRDEKTGVEVGKRPTRMIIYDKLKEQQTKTDALYLQGLIDRRWHGETPAVATRIEFQLSRPWLLHQGVSSPADFWRLQGSLIGMLTTEWFRLTDQPVDRKNKNHSRAGTHALWSGIQEGFAGVFGEPSGPLVPIQREKIKPRRLLLQGRGCLANAILQIGRPVKGYTEFVAEIGRVLLELFPCKAEREAFMREFHNREGGFDPSV